MIDSVLPPRPTKPVRGPTTGFQLFAADKKYLLAENGAAGTLKAAWDALHEDEQDAYEARAGEAMVQFNAAAAKFSAENTEYAAAVVACAERARKLLDFSMDNLRDRIVALVSELKADPTVRVLACRIGDPVSEDVIHEVKAAAGGTLPIGMEAFYRSVGEFTLEREAAKAGNGALDREAGAIHILPLVTPNAESADTARGAVSGGIGVFGDWQGSTWSVGQETAETFKQIRPVDCFAADACVALYPANPIRPQRLPTMHYHQYGTALHDLAIDFREYVALMLLSRGYQGWPLALCYETMEEPQAIAFMQRLPELFPGIDMAAFLPRIAQVVDSSGDHIECRVGRAPVRWNSRRVW